MLDINFIRNHQQDLSLIANQKGLIFQSRELFN